MSFVRISNEQFDVAGAPIYITGANCYYLGYKSRRMVDAVLDAAARIGFTVIRTWGFMDESKEGVVFQSWHEAAASPVYNDAPDGLGRLDYLIHAAGRRGLKLILPLVNYWPDFGGMDRYTAWYGLHNRAEFYTNSNTRRAYRDWVNHVLTRKNPLTGLEYRDDPTVMAWELTNEARCDFGHEALLSWTAEMAAHLKSIDANHLVAMGDEGLFRRAGSRDWAYDGRHGCDFEALLGVPEIDFGTFHLYGDTWNVPRDFGKYWIRDHIDAGVRARKPVLLEEYGWKGKIERNTVYREWLDAIYFGGGGGDLVWMIADVQDDGTPYPDFDGFTVYANDVPSAITTHIARVDRNNSAAAAAITS